MQTTTDTNTTAEKTAITENFSLVVNPGKLNIVTRAYPDGKPRSIFCKIEYEAGRLSISGVEGPYSNGDAAGSCGQINPVQLDQFSEGWTPEILARFNDVWERWHLNDMRAECEHQCRDNQPCAFCCDRVGDGEACRTHAYSLETCPMCKGTGRTPSWRELARIEVTLYHFRLTSATCTQRKAAENEAIKALQAGETFTPTEEQTRLARLSYAITTHEAELNESLRDFYEPKRPLYSGDQSATEKKTLGWLKPSEHPAGLLSRPCPVCGYKRGSSWLREEVPPDVLDFLRTLPPSKLTPAWV